MNNPQQNTRAPARYSEPRIPYNLQFEEKFGISRMFWRLLVEQVFPTAKTAEGVLLAVAYCKHRQLDILKRPVHVVPIYDSQQGKEIESVWPGINELRTTAARTKLYAGKDAAVFGPNITREFMGFTKKGGEQKISVTFPEWCQVTVYKMIDGQRCAFHSPKVYWLETYSRLGKTDLPNTMWQKRPSGQLEKCTEAAALRVAFPEEIGEDYIPEEVGAHMMRDVTPERPKMEDFAEQPRQGPTPGATEPENEPGLSTGAQEPEEQPAEESATEQEAEPKKKAATKKAEPKREPQEAESPDTSAQWKVEGDTFTYLANWTKKLKEATAPEHVDAMKGINSERIAKFSDELQQRLWAAADERKEQMANAAE